MVFYVDFKFWDCSIISFSIYFTLFVLLLLFDEPPYSNNAAVVCSATFVVAFTAIIPAMYFAFRRHYSLYAICEFHNHRQRCSG